MLQIILVALPCIFSNSTTAWLRYEYQNCTQYSRYGQTIDFCKGMMSLSVFNSILTDAKHSVGMRKKKRLGEWELRPHQERGASKAAFLKVRRQWHGGGVGH